MDYTDEFEHHAADALATEALQELLVANDTLESFLGELAAAAARETEHHCGITIRAPSVARLYTAASSDALAARLDELQYDHGYGPCLEAMHRATPVFVGDMAREPRWSPYPAEALAAGVRSLLSYPLISSDQCIGALNFYSAEPRLSGTELQLRAAALAGRAAGAVALALRLAERNDLIAKLRVTLSSRSTIDQAVGILMAQQHCDAQAAFNLLRRASQGRNVKLREVAASVVAGVARHSLTSASEPEE